jgi:hypothetical protein
MSCASRAIESRAEYGVRHLHVPAPRSDARARASGGEIDIQCVEELGGAQARVHRAKRPPHHDDQRTTPVTRRRTRAALHSPVALAQVRGCQLGCKLRFGGEGAGGGLPAAGAKILAILSVNHCILALKVMPHTLFVGFCGLCHYNLPTNLRLKQSKKNCSCCGCRFSTALQLELACLCTCFVPCATAAR